MAITGSESHFPFIVFSDSYPMIGIDETKLDKMLSPIGVNLMIFQSRVRETGFWL